MKKEEKFIAKVTEFEDGSNSDPILHMAFNIF
jgi:hypothetical protein